jgi:hypothetical protein
VLWHEPGLTLPCPDQQDDALASLGDAIAAVVEIRRQLTRPTLDLRSLYKVTALAAKVALRADGEDYPGDAEALRALAARHPEYFARLDAGAVTAARDDEQAATAIARAVLTWSLSMLPAGQGSQ